MPTPNEPLATLPGIDNELSRPSRLHLVCPPDEAIVFRSTATPARPRSAWRLLDDVSVAPPMNAPSMTRGQHSRTRVPDDEAAAKPQGEVEKGPRTEPSSPTLEGEHVDDCLEGGTPHGLLISTSSPDTPSLSYEFSSKRVSFLAFFIVFFFSPLLLPCMIS